MVPNANARFFMLKAKQRDLIAACGGQIRAAGICHYGKSTVGRWADANSPELMPLDAVFALEEECGRFDVSEAIAAARGRRFAEAEVSATDNLCVMASHADAVVQMGELMTAGAIAFADGKLTPSRRPRSTGVVVGRAFARDYRRIVAAVRGQGGASLLRDA